MKWNEMTTARKILTVLELVSGILLWIFYLLLIFDVPGVAAAVLILMLVNCVCRILTAGSKALKILWSILCTFICLLSVWALWMYLR